MEERVGKKPTLFLINTNMKLNEIIKTDLFKYLIESNLNVKTTVDSMRALMGLKKFGFDPKISGWDNQKTIDDRYESLLFALMNKQAKNINKDIYDYISNKYQLKSINWNASNSTLSQYIYITLKNGIRLEIRVSDHSKPLGQNTSIYIFNVFYYTLLNDKLKEKIDNFINKFNQIKLDK